MVSRIAYIPTFHSSRRVAHCEQSIAVLQYRVDENNWARLWSEQIPRVSNNPALIFRTNPCTKICAYNALLSEGHLLHSELLVSSLNVTESRYFEQI
jgi:hypothetical protein